MRTYELPDYIETHNLFPKMIYKSFDRNGLNDLSKYIIYRYDTKLVVNKQLLNKINYLVEEEYDGLKINNLSDIKNLNAAYNYYIVDTDTYIFEKALVEYVMDGNGVEVDFGIYYKNKLNLPSIFNDKIYIPENIKYNPILNLNNAYTQFEKEEMTIIDDKLIYFKNMPFEMFNNQYVFFNQLNYVVNKNTWTSTRKESHELIPLIESFSNGIKYPLCMTLEGNKVIPIACNWKLLISYYLNFPSIPVCIIVSDDKLVYNNKIIL